MNRVEQHPVHAFFAALAAVGILSIMDAVMKHLVLAIGILAVSVWRAVVNLGFSSALYLPRRTPWPGRAILKVHVARGVLIVVMATSFFWGIGRVPLAQAIALTFIAPLIALLLASLFLDEKIGRRSILGSIAAFAGVIVIVVGQSRTSLGPQALIGSLAILGSALCYAVNIVMMRHQAQTADPFEINFFQALTVLAVWIAAIPVVGPQSWPGEQWPWLLLAASLSTIGTLLFGWAYARGEASYLAVTEYSAFLWAALMGWLMFREPVSITTIGGALLIVGGCLIAARGRAEPPEMDYA